jgi:hypothetical protein
MDGELPLMGLRTTTNEQVLQEIRCRSPAQKDTLISSDVIAVPANEFVSVNLDHHHLWKLGYVKSGRQVAFRGRGAVERSETRSTKDGERA